MNDVAKSLFRPGLKLNSAPERPLPVFVALERGWYCVRIDQRMCTGLQLNNYLDEVMRWRMNRPSNQIFWGNDLTLVPGYPDLPCLYGFDQVIVFGDLKELLAFNEMFPVSKMETILETIG